MLIEANVLFHPTYQWLYLHKSAAGSRMQSEHDQDWKKEMYIDQSDG